MAWFANPERYEQMLYRYCGRSGLRLPALSLGLWHSFGHVQALDSQRALLRKAFDLGITHFDLANNYGPPPGSAEENFGRLLREDFAHYRDELIISTKAGYDMWPGPYGSGGSRKYLLASLDQSLKRLGVEYVDIFYSHRVDENTPMEETASALAHAVQSGKALYDGISSYSTDRTQKMAELLREWKIPLLIHQPSYNLLNRWVDKTGLLDALEANGTGCIAFTPLAQGLLTGKYLNIHHNLVHAVQGGDVDMTMVAGKIVVEDGCLKTASLQSLIADANAVVPGLFQRREAWLKTNRAVSRGAT